MKKTQQNPTKPNETQRNPNEKTVTPKQDKIKQDNNLVVVVKEDQLALTDSEIHESITRDQQIEDAARDVGLQVSTQAMLKARDLADKYGTEELIKAIRLSVDAPRWSYVEGILKNRGDKKHDRHPTNDTKPSENPYGFLHGRETAV